MQEQSGMFLCGRIDFGQAFTLVRKHRINLNLLYDYKPSVFLQHVTAFITQLDSAAHVNLFLTDLVCVFTPVARRSHKLYQLMWLKGIFLFVIHVLLVHDVKSS